MTRILVPIRYAAWLAGKLGTTLESELRRLLRDLPTLSVMRMPRGFLIETSEREGPAIERLADAVRRLEATVAERYPVFHHEMGPLWTGTLQILFD